MGKQGDGIIPIVEACHYSFEDLQGGVIEFGDKMDVLCFFTKGFDKDRGGLAGSFGGAGYEAIDGHICFYQSLGHDGGVPFASLIQRSIEIAHVNAVPAAFRMSYYQ